MLYWPDKRSEEVDDYGCDWSSALGVLGAVNITASSWTLLQGDVTLHAAAFTPTTTSIRLEGGMPGEHILRNTITTNLGQVRSKRCFIRIL